MISKIASFFMMLTISFLAVFGIGVPHPSGYDVITDVAYGDEEGQTLDLIIPEGLGKELSLAVFIHGGAWFGGDKSYETDKTQYMAEKGMISANVNYRLLNKDRRELTCDTQLQDIDNGVKKIVEICSAKGYSINRAIIWGKSAGGHLSLMYAYTYKDKSPVDIGLVYSICGATDLTDTNYFSKTEFTTEQVLLFQSALSGKEVTAENFLAEETQSELKRVSPVYCVTSASVPTIFNSCGRDPLIPLSNAQRLEKALKANGVDYYYDNFANSNHCGRHGFDFFTYTAFDYHLNKMIDKYVK